jgi:hypothetical protein
LTVVHDGFFNVPPEIVVPWQYTDEQVFVFLSHTGERLPVFTRLLQTIRAGAPVMWPASSDDAGTVWQLEQVMPDLIDPPDKWGVCAPTARSVRADSPLRPNGGEPVVLSFPPWQ